MALIHGGQLQQQVLRYNIPEQDWLDLSTGISPISYPIPNIPTAIWQQLPQPQASLIAAAKQYYQTEQIIATSGSQAVIKQLPNLFKQHVLTTPAGIQQASVWLPRVGYKEHEKSWRDLGFHIQQYDELPRAEMLTKHCVVVVINPNNPSAALYSSETILSLLNHVQACHGWLIVDEAFMDVINPSQSVIAHTHNRHLFVLRSVGKFFGLAGIRIGFLSAHPDWLQAFTFNSSPWEVNAPAQYITEKALKDKLWQQQQLIALTKLTQQTKQVLKQYFKQESKGTSLFQTVKLKNAADVYQALCQRGVYVRLCDEQDALRFGIGQEQDITQLNAVLKDISKTISLNKA